LKLIETELDTNKSSIQAPYILQKKKEQLLVWIPMKILRNAIV